MTPTPTFSIGIAAALFCYAPPSLAYLDPGTGSMIMSAIVGLFATAVLAVKTYWYRIKRLFRGAPDKEGEEPAKPAADGGPGRGRDSG